MRLFKLDQKGRIRILDIFTEGGELIQKSGLINGELVEHRKLCKIKNTGKSNETNIEEQALFEMNSKIREKLTEGYFQTQKEAETEQVILPMLAKDYKEEKGKIDWTKDVYIQPKLDGMRCLAHIKNHKVELISRDGKNIENMDHIKQSLSVLDDIILDGELYCHGLSFQENMKLIKKYRVGESENIKFHVYDVVENTPFWIRNNLALLSSRKCNEIVLVKTDKIINKVRDLQIYHSKFLEEGYEGSIIRHGDAPYKTNGRSSNLLKYKDFIDIAIPIKNIEPADQRPEWGVPVFEWKGAKDDELRAGMKYSHEERKEFLQNKENYIGKTAEVRFFEYSDEGVPRFPVMIGIRLDK